MEENAVLREEPQRSGLPQQFIAVFFDDNNEVQIGASSLMSQDTMLWVRMMELAIKKIELAAYQNYLEQASGQGIIRPR